MTDRRWQPDTGYDTEERQLMAILEELSFQGRRVTKERLRRQNAEKKKWKESLKHCNYRMKSFIMKQKEKKD